MHNIERLALERSKLTNLQAKLWQDMNKVGYTRPEQLDLRITKFQHKVIVLSHQEMQELDPAKRAKIARERLEAEKITRHLRERALRMLERERNRLYSRYKRVSEEIAKYDQMLKKAGARP